MSECVCVCMSACADSFYSHTHCEVGDKKVFITILYFFLACMLVRMIGGPAGVEFGLWYCDLGKKSKDGDISSRERIRDLKV